MSDADCLCPISIYTRCSNLAPNLVVFWLIYKEFQGIRMAYPSFTQRYSKYLHNGLRLSQYLQNQSVMSRLYVMYEV